MKKLLRDEILPLLGGRTPYYSMRSIRYELDVRKCTYRQATLNRYLYELTRIGEIHSAGRGWYSSLCEPFRLDTSPVLPLVDELARQFPLVAFSCWSTQQIQAALHHLFGKFVIVVNVEADAMESVWRYLRDNGWFAWLNPRGSDAARFELRERTIVIRRKSVKSRSRDRVTIIEELLVEFYLEVRELDIISISEYQAMLGVLVGRKRIRIAGMLDYAAERNIEAKEIFGAESQLIPII